MGWWNLKRPAGEGRSLSSLPSNLLSEWAKRNPQAAFDWVQLDKELSFNSGLDEFIDGYAEVATDEEIGSFVAQLYDPQEEERERYDQAWDALSEVEDEDAVRQFLTDVSAHGSEAEHLQGLLLESSGSSGGSYDATRAILISMMDEDVRYRYFTSKDGDWLHRDYVRKSVLPVLERLGHSSEEIAVMLPLKEED